VITFWRSNSPAEHRLAEYFSIGAKVVGLDFITMANDGYTGPLGETTVAITTGVKYPSRRIIEEHAMLGKKFICVDKGYKRGRGSDPAAKMSYYRASVGGFQPLDYFQMIPRPSDRWDRLGFVIEPRKKGGRDIIYAGSSQKYSDFKRLGDANAYANKIMRRAFKHCPKAQRGSIIYRPKPSWKGAEPVPKFKFSQNVVKINRALMDAYALITYGSNAALDSILAGVPTVVLGDSIAQPIAMKELSDLREPTHPDSSVIHQWGCDLAYCQWTPEEMRSGEMWETLLENLRSVDSE